MTTINMMLINDQMLAAVNKVQYKSIAMLKQKTYQLLKEAGEGYVIFYHSDCYFEDSFAGDFEKCFKKYSVKPDVVIWNRVHDYKYKDQSFQSSWAVFHDTFLLNRKEFVQCFPSLVREYEALAFRGCCNRAYSIEYALKYLEDILCDVGSRLSGEGFCSLANITQAMFMESSVKVHKICSGISIKKYWEYMETFYVDLLYLFNNWCQDQELEYGYDVITGLGAQYMILQLNNMSYHPQYSSTGNVKVDIRLFVQGMEKWMESAIFRDIILFQENAHDVIFSEIRKLFITASSGKSRSTLNDERYQQLLKDVSALFPVEAVGIVLVKHCAQREMSETIKEIAYSGRFYKNCSWLIWYIIFHELLNNSIRKISTQEDLEVLKLGYKSIKSCAPENIVTKAFDVIIAVFEQNNEEANRIIGQVEDERKDCVWFYKLCYKLCCELGIPELGSEFYIEFAGVPI